MKQRNNTMGKTDVKEEKRAGVCPEVIFAVAMQDCEQESV